MFDAKKVTRDCIQWIKDWFDNNGKDCNAIVGISGGADSSIVAALCVEALGRNRVVGIMLPNNIVSDNVNEQADMSAAKQLIKHLGIKSHCIEIGDMINIIYSGIDFDVNIKTGAGFEPTAQAEINLRPRIRMSLLYFMSQSLNGRVANTCNLSEDWVGYSTRYGDSVGDFSPLSKLTKTEVKAIGYELGLPKELIEKVPSDGLCGKTDEDSFGFTYDVLDRYIRDGICEDENIKAKIDAMHERNLFKLQLMPVFEYKE